MPLKPILYKEDILNAAIEMIRETGIENVNARSLAGKLNCFFRLHITEF